MVLEHVYSTWTNPQEQGCTAALQYGMWYRARTELGLR